MRTRVIAVMELVLIFPAVLFMTALVLRNLQPLQYEPARSAQQLVASHVVRRPDVDVMVSVVRSAVTCICQRLRRVATQLQPRRCSAAYIAEIVSHGPCALVFPFHCRDNTDCRSHTGNCRLARPSELTIRPLCDCKRSVENLTENGLLRDLGFVSLRSTV
jgi:hypothetical protein